MKWSLRTAEVTEVLARQTSSYYDFLHERLKGGSSDSHARRKGWTWWWIYSLQVSWRFSSMLLLQLCPRAPPGFVPHTFKRWNASQFRGKNATKLHSEEASQQTPSCYRTTPVAGLLLLVVAAYLLSSCYSFNSFAELQKRAHLSLLLMYWNCSLTANYLPYLKKWLILRCEETYTGPLLQWPQLNICLNCKFPSEVFIEFNRFWSEVQIKYCPCPDCKSWEHRRWKVP